MTIQAKRSITIEDVARVAGVSRAAVSKVIRDAYGVSDDMRARVQAAIDELGYRPRAAARAMRGSSYTLGVEIPTIKNHFFTKIITGATGALAGSRYNLIIAPADPDHDGGPQAIELLVDRQVDGILAISPAVAPEWLEDLAQRTPLVMLGRHDIRPTTTRSSTTTSRAPGWPSAIFYDLGHRDIVHLTLGPRRSSTCPPPRTRCAPEATSWRWPSWASRTSSGWCTSAREEACTGGGAGAPNGPQGPSDRHLRRSRRARPRRAAGGVSNSA